MFNINLRSNIPIYEQLVDKIKENIVRGYLKPMDSLPSVRKLATMLDVNPNTVSKAYQELERQHLIITIRGKGTFVDEINHDNWIDLDVYLQKLRPIITEMKLKGLTETQVTEQVHIIYTELDRKEDEQ